MNGHAGGSTYRVIEAAEHCGRRAFDISTKDLAQYSQSSIPRNPGVQHGREMLFAGGMPLTRGGKVVGGVGVGGVSGEQDHAIAEAGAKAF
jgi:uncharacterized protein GlcG (DUF336 family)